MQGSSTAGKVLGGIMIALGLLVVTMGMLGVACAWVGDDEKPDAPATADDPYESVRMRMVEYQIERRGIQDEAVLGAMRKAPRHLFVPPSERPYAYNDGALPIGYRQTISQPYIVALMTSLVRPGPSMKVLEIGTGSGYQAAVLSEIVAEVYTIEIVPELGQRSAKLLRTLGYENIHTRIGDGYDGWPEAAPFDAVVVTAAPDEVPQPLLDQLAVGGSLVIPVGRHSQDLVLFTRTDDGYRREQVTGVRFVPMTGKAQDD